MTAAVLRMISTECDRLEGLSVGLGSATSVKEVMEEAWRWFNRHAVVDALAVSLLGPPEPALYLLAGGPLSADLRERLTSDMVVTSASLRSEPGAFPQRASDLAAWDAGEAPVTSAVRPLVVGQWTLDLSGRPGALVRLLRFGYGPTDPELGPLFLSASQMVALYVRALQVMPLALSAQTPAGDTFEELLELEVTTARQRQAPVSLVLIEVDVALHSDGEAAPTEAELGEVGDVVRRVVRGGDRVTRVWDGCLAVVMPKTDARGALIGADRIQRSLRDHFGRQRSRLAFWVGIGGRDPEENEASELFSRAAQALAQARTAQSDGAFLYV